MNLTVNRMTTKDEPPKDIPEDVKAILEGIKTLVILMEYSLKFDSMRDVGKVS